MSLLVGAGLVLATGGVGTAWLNAGGPDVYREAPEAQATITPEAAATLLASEPEPNLAAWQLELSPADQALLRVGAYAGELIVTLNEGQPQFDITDALDGAFEHYSDLDEFGRCGYAYACLGTELMPSRERGVISWIHPSGWSTNQYDFIEGGLLYNRSHLIAFSLADEDANALNLISGTCEFNKVGMQRLELRVLEYIRATGNHVLYRVTPVFAGDNLVANGVQMEALSVEDGGRAICANVFVYNVQPGVVIDYATGENWLDPTADLDALYPGYVKTEPDRTTIVLSDGSLWTEVDRPEAPESAVPGYDEERGEPTYVINKKTLKFHFPWCSSVTSMKESNRLYFYGERDELVEAGYAPCGACQP